MLKFLLICFGMAVVFYISNIVLIFLIYTLVNIYRVIGFLIRIMLYPFRWFFGLFSNSKDAEEPEAFEEIQAKTQKADEKELSLYDPPYILFRLVANLVTSIIICSKFFSLEDGHLVMLVIITYIPATIIAEIFIHINSLSDSTDTN